jgi:hypothetical protein
MSKASVSAALKACAADMRSNFEKPNDRVVAECLVTFDCLAICGYATEMAELRAMKDPIAFAIQTLKGK